MLETLNAVKLLESPCIVISEGEKELFPESFAVFTTPKPRYFWLNPCSSIFPFSLVAGYIAAMKGGAALPYRHSGLLRRNWERTA